MVLNSAGQNSNSFNWIKLQFTVNLINWKYTNETNTRQDGCYKHVDVDVSSMSNKLLFSKYFAWNQINNVLKGNVLNDPLLSPETCEHRGNILFINYDKMHCHLARYRLSGNNPSSDIHVLSQSGWWSTKYKMQFRTSCWKAESNFKLNDIRYQCRVFLSLNNSHELVIINCLL